VIAAPQVGTPDAPAEKSVSGEKAGASPLLDQKRATPGRVSGGVKNAELDSSRPERLSVDQRPVHLCTYGGTHPEEFRLHGKKVVQGPVGLVDTRGGACGSLKLGGAAHVIEVRVRMYDRIDLYAESRQAAPNDVVVPAGIDDDGALGLEVGHDRAVAPERTDGQRFDVHEQRLLPDQSVSS
jgi:hypothetical protein